MYRVLIQEAEATGDPVRATKCRGIRREARAHIVTNCPTDEIPTEAQLESIVSSFRPLRVGCFRRISAIEKYGRGECRDMINRSLPYVVAYDPETDPVWPY